MEKVLQKKGDAPTYTTATVLMAGKTERSCGIIWLALGQKHWHHCDPSFTLTQIICCFTFYPGHISVLISRNVSRDITNINNII